MSLLIIVYIDKKYKKSEKNIIVEQMSEFSKVMWYKIKTKNRSYFYILANKQLETEIINNSFYNHQPQILKYLLINPPLQSFHIVLLPYNPSVLHLFILLSFRLKLLATILVIFQNVTIGMTQDIDFSDCLFSFSNMHCRFFHMYLYHDSSFLFIAKYYCIVYVCPWFVYSI